ncbi:hypothetical protein CVM39_03745 [Pseudooceanicola antarcticus]|uniref:Cellulose biosynthesis protein BcsS n=1 Tax=Pseudooceanicola antarcticus TaxID=1247613 RepID=A0ABX4MVH4_9RHOB|nr:hypothetical protein CVM39_03745 [Pseudooceanicola antarcticus]
MGAEDGSWTQSYTLFHEYGLTDRLTLSTDFGGAISGLEKLVSYVSVPMGERLGFRLALDMGAGKVAGEWVLRPGLSFGRGLERPSGWIAGELAAEVFAGTGAVDWKFDLTLGLSPGRRAKYYMQLQSGQRAGDPAFARLAGSLAWKIRDGTWLDIGGSVGLANSDPYRLKLGIWREF